jgi:hypothetical protein
MPKTSWIKKNDRRIKVFDHEKTQSVNVCTAENKEGDYEEVFYFCERFRISVEDLERYKDFATLRKDLRKRSHRQVIELWEAFQKQ